MAGRSCLALAAVLAFASPAAASMPPSIWFQSDSVRLTPRDQEILDFAASEARRLGAEDLCILTSADRAGSTAYNFRLSARRGQIVRAEMVRRGFSADRIAIQVLGESRPLIETADGVAEPQNRFAMISYGPHGCTLGI